MKTYVVFLPMLDAEKSKLHRPEHLAYLEEQAAQGHIFAKGPFVDGSGGMVIYKAKSMEDVEMRVKNDPYVQTGARSYEIREWAMN
ncbi:YciI family protein [Ferviditalea candida]|uniref:YciI family protein n=1 Tax=Ferviditalea candida TaxID=3108399 RepID=A0ABU5ZHF3_9BACL|nr:YciI family protein [Paenibacillaceae bacterium T2]